MVIIYGNYLARAIIFNNAYVIIESIILILVLFMAKAFKSEWKPSIYILIYIHTWYVLILYTFVVHKQRIEVVNILIDEAKYMEHFLLQITLKYLNGPSNTETNRLTSCKWPSLNMPQTL